ncbi:hypothetical protein MRX96_037833 [Rhipicephalus microplus]
MIASIPGLAHRGIRARSRCRSVVRKAEAPRRAAITGREACSGDGLEDSGPEHKYTSEHGVRASMCGRERRSCMRAKRPDHRILIHARALFRDARPDHKPPHTPFLFPLRN